ncbi:MAG: kinase [Candidatus Micrarchaeia archaeon]
MNSGSDFSLVTTKTPLRITFTGGGTDLMDYYRKHGPGAVVSSTINRYIYVTVARNFYRDEIRVSYSKSEDKLKSIDEIQHPSVREALRFLGIKGGLQIVSITEIPSKGTGLGSSSSFLVGLLYALHTWLGEAATQEQLASEAFHIEREVLREEGGKQDQYIAAYGGIRLMEFNSDESVSMKPIVLKEDAREILQDSLLMLYTGKERSSSEIHKEQAKSIEDKLEAYGEMRKLAYETYSAIAKCDIAELGALMDTNWKLKKKLSNGISDPLIDSYYEKAIKSGALGGKLMGAGGGGFLLFVAPKEKHKAIEDALGLRQEPFKLDPLGSRIINMEGLA